MHHLDDQLFRQLVQQIVTAVSPERIYLLGVSQSQQANHSIFTGRPVTAGYPSHYLWLVLVEPQGPGYLQSVQDKIEMLSAAHTPVMAWVLTTDSFARQLAAGDYFVCRVHEQAPLCYYKGSIDFPAPGSVTSYSLLSQQARAFMRRAGELLAGVELYLLRREFALAALLLHQSAEQLFTAVIYTATGYRPQTHNLERLYQYAWFLHQPLAHAWPLHTRNSQEQLHHLNKAYINSRYGQYTIQEAVLRSIAGTLRQLHAAAAA